LHAHNHAVLSCSAPRLYRRAILIAVGLLPAQVTTGTLYVIVTDPSGAVISGANVALTDVATGAVREKACDEHGECDFTFLLPSSYHASITASNFKTLEVSDIRLDSGQDIRRTFVLAIGDVAEKVSVSGEAPIVNTVSPVQLNTQGSAALAELPVANRMVAQLIQVNTSVSMSSGGNTAGSFTLNGLAAGGTSITMDGIPANAHPGSPQGGFRGGFNNIDVASLEAVQEVDVAKGVFPAEYGRAMSGNINVITKSGTNQLHGSIFELFNSEDLNGRQAFLTSRPPTTSNQFGGSVGGPILKNRLFFFGVYEGYQDQTTTTINGVVPTPSLRAAMIANSPGYQLLLNEYYLPNQPYSATATTGQYIGSGTTVAEDNPHLEAKVDYILSSNSRLSATYVHDRPNIGEPLGPAADFYVNYWGYLDRLNVTYTTFRANWSSETRFGWNRVNNQRTGKDYYLRDLSEAETAADIGELREPSISGLGINNSNYGENYIGNAPEWNLEHTTSWHLGNHSFKFGGGLYRHEYGEKDLEEPVLTYNTAQQLIANTPVSAQFTFGFEPWVGKQLDFGLFIQDDWRVSRKLVLNLGLRYDYYDHMVANGANAGWPHWVNASFSDFASFTLAPFRPYNNPYDTHPLNLGPRFGFAYNPDGRGKTAIRGGFGIMTEPINVSIFEQTGINAPTEPFRVVLTQANIQANGIQFPTYNEDVLGLVENGIVPPAYQFVDPHIKVPYAMNYTLGIEHAITSSLMFETAYVGNRGVDLVQPRYYNQADPITGIRPNPSLGQGRYWDNSDSSNFNSWQSSLRQRFHHNLSASANYTWEKVLSYGDGDITYISPSSSLIQNFFDVRANRGRSPQDVAHSFIANFVYDLPFFVHSNGFLRNTLGGWEGSGIFKAQTGLPLTVTESSGSVYGRPDLVNPGNAIVDRGLQYLNSSAFLAVPVSSISGEQTRPGSAGFGDIFGPGLWNLDFALSKNFQLTERLRFQLRAEMLNALNHPNPNVVNMNFSSSAFGEITGATAARVIQFHARVSF
jgi:hypothetical protein